jgi:nucleotide-binding universal stress UspA family protein
MVPVRGDGKGEGVMNHAHAIAKKFDAHIDVLHARARPQDMMPYGVLMTAAMKQTILDAAKAQAETEEDRVRELFDVHCKKLALNLVDAASAEPGGNTVSWREIVGKQADLIGVHGRVADLIVVPKPDKDMGQNTLEAALMSTGTRTLMCPDNPVGSIGDRISLAWNGSAESARVAKATLPFLQKASHVTVVTNDADGKSSGLHVDEFQRMLDRHGVETELLNFIGSSDIGTHLLGAISATRTDMLIMGAYSHSRRREMVMGGATHEIIEQAALPVLMLH